MFVDPQGPAQIHINHGQETCMAGGHGPLVGSLEAIPSPHFPKQGLVGKGSGTSNPILGNVGQPKGSNQGKGRNPCPMAQQVVEGKPKNGKDGGVKGESQSYKKGGHIVEQDGGNRIQVIQNLKAVPKPMNKGNHGFY